MESTQEVRALRAEISQAEAAVESAERELQARQAGLHLLRARQTKMIVEWINFPNKKFLGFSYF